MTRLLLPVVVFAAAVFAQLPSPSVALGHGQGTEIFRERQGRYELVVAIQPARPVLGSVHFTITPLDAETSTVVSDARVTVVANDEADQPTYQAQAVNSPEWPQFYDANFTMESEGAWTLAREAASPSMGEATFVVPFEVGPPAIGASAAGMIVWLVVIGVLAGGTILVWRSSRRAHSRD